MPQVQHSRKTAIVLGAGPGLGMSIAHRFGKEGFAVALVSRSAARHEGYVSALADRGVEAAAFVADTRDRDQVQDVVAAATSRFGTIDVAYYGPGGVDLDHPLHHITEIDSDEVRAAMKGVYAAIDVVNAALPAMIERGDGGLLIAGG